MSTISETLKSLFDSQEKESGRLRKELDSLEATYPAVRAQYDAIDTECIRLAAQYRAEKDAGSDRRYSTEAELKAMRLKRDNGMGVYTRARSELRRQLENINFPTINEFSQDCLKHVQRLFDGRIAKFQIQTYNKSGNVKSVTVQHNRKAVNALRDEIMAAQLKVKAMELRPLEEIRATIADYKRKWANANIDILEVADIDPDDLREWTEKPDKSNVTSAYPLAGGGVILLDKKGTTDNVSQNAELLHQYENLKTKLGRK